MNRDPVDRIESAVTLDARVAPSSAHLDALLEGVMARVDAPAEVIPLRRPLTSRWRAGFALVAAAATAAAAVAVTDTQRTTTAPVRATTASSAQQVDVRAHTAEPAPAVPSHTPSTVAPTPAAVPALRADPMPTADRVPAREVPSAAAMYRLANEARHQRDDVSAMRAYDQLIAAHPRARESVQARVTLGRMLLDRRERVARAASLAEEALAAGAQSSDAETAMVLRAQAYRALSRDADERRAWTALLARFPDSLQADTARARLDALR